MTHDQLTGKYARLRHELDAAYAEPEWSACRTGHIDRIAGELSDIEHVLASGAGRLQGYAGAQEQAGRNAAAPPR